MSSPPPEDQPPGEALVPTTDESALSAVGDESPENPTYVAVAIWTVALQTGKASEEVFFNLSFGGADRWSFEEVAERLRGLSPVVPCTFTSPDTAYVKFIEDPQQAMRVQNAALTMACHLNMVRCDDGWWRMWSLGGDAILPENFHPEG